MCSNSSTGLAPTTVPVLQGYIRALPTAAATAHRQRPDPSPLPLPQTLRTGRILVSGHNSASPAPPQGAAAQSLDLQHQVKRPCPAAH